MLRSVRYGDPERGAGTVLVLGVVAVAVLLAVVLAALASAQGARGRAQAAADLAALSGASARRHGEDACAVAARVVERNGVALGSCLQEPGGAVRVEARSAVGVGPFRAVLGDAEARARAGVVGSP